MKGQDYKANATGSLNNCNPHSEKNTQIEYIRDQNHTKILENLTTQCINIFDPAPFHDIDFAKRVCPLHAAEQVCGLWACCGHPELDVVDGFGLHFGTNRWTSLQYGFV